MTDSEAVKRCPKCGAANLEEELPQRDYRCGDCGIELAHLDTLPTGGVRGVLGMLLDIGTLVHDRYRVVAVLGKGGFGVTYLVDDELLHGKRRALKEVPALMFDEYETRLLGRLNHPAIPDISDRFESDGMVYQVLEFGGDRTLRIEKERRGGRIPLFVLLPWMRQLCEALEYLHGQDPPVVHRDLKPDNVLLDEHDRVMLIDFGIAKEATPDTATRTIGRAVSQGFSPPEQVLGTGTDARSDVYALGAIQYYCLTGAMPTPAHERITGKALEPISKFLPEIPPLIEAAVMQALELNINNRQQSIAELASVFELVQTGSGSAPTISVAAAHASTTSPSTTDSLPSVELPSRRTTTGRTAGAVSEPSMHVSQTAAGLASQPPPPPARRRSAVIWLAAGVLPLVVAGAGGYWWWSEYGATTGAESGPESSPMAKSETEAGQPSASDSPTDGQPAVLSKVADGGTPVTEPSGAPAEKLDAMSAAALAPSTQSVPPTMTDPDRLGQAGQAAQAAAADATANPIEPQQADSEGATVAAAAAAAGAATAVAAKAPSSMQPSASAPAAGPLPSIFSDEQPASSRLSSLNSSSQGSTTLMDLFDRQRTATRSESSQASGAASGSAEPAATKTAKASAQPAPKPAVKPQPKPKPKVASAPKPRPRPKPTPKPKTSSASDWGFQYKGARKTD